MIKKKVTQIQMQSHADRKGKKLNNKELEEHLKAFTDIEDSISELYRKNIKEKE